MAYSTQADLLKSISAEELSELTSESDTVIDSAVVASAIADADSEIDGYVATRYAVPLSPVPPVIKKYSVQIALYNLFSRRANRLGAMNDVVKDNYAAAVDFLKNVAKGVATLGVDPPPAKPTGTGATFEADKPADNRQFTKDSMKGF